MGVVPESVQVEFGLERHEIRPQHEQAQTLGLDGSDQALDDGDGAVLSEGTETGPHTLFFAPRSVPLLKLFALVGDDVAGGPARSLNSFIEHTANVLCRWQRFEAGGGKLGPGKMVLDDDHPAAEGPAHPEEGKPSDPETACHRHRRQIDVPEMMRAFRGDDSSALSFVGRLVGPWGFCLSVPRPPRRRRALELAHPIDGGRGEVKPRSCQHVGNLPPSETWTQGSSDADDVGNEVRETVDRDGSLDERIGSFFVEPMHPGADGGGRDQEAPSRLGNGPASARF
jgi:hypothetical protein